MGRTLKELIAQAKELASRIEFPPGVERPTLGFFRLGWRSDATHVHYLWPDGSTWIRAERATPGLSEQEVWDLLCLSVRRLHPENVHTILRMFEGEDPAPGSHGTMDVSIHSLFNSILEPPEVPWADQVRFEAYHPPSN